MKRMRKRKGQKRKLLRILMTSRETATILPRSVVHLGVSFLGRLVMLAITH